MEKTILNIGLIVFVTLGALITIIHYVMNETEQEELEFNNNEAKQRLTKFIISCNDALVEYNDLMQKLQQPLGARVLRKNGFYFSAINYETIINIKNQAEALLADIVCLQSKNLIQEINSTVSTFISSNSEVLKEYNELIMSYFMAIRSEENSLKEFSHKLHELYEKLTLFKHDFITYYENTTKKQFNEGDILVAVNNDFQNKRIYANMYRNIILAINEVKEKLLHQVLESEYDSAIEWYEMTYINLIDYTEKLQELKETINNSNSISNAYTTIQDCLKNSEFLTKQETIVENYDNSLLYNFYDLNDTNVQETIDLFCRITETYRQVKEDAELIIDFIDSYIFSDVHQIETINQKIENIQKNTELYSSALLIVNNLQSIKKIT